AVRDHHQDAALLRPPAQPIMRPNEGLAVDVLLEDAFAQHQPEAAPGAPPRGVRRFIDDVAQIVEPPRVGRLAGANPALARLPALPRARRKAEDFNLNAAAFEGARQDVGAHRRDGDRPAAHRPRIVDQQGHDGVAEIGLALALVGQGEDRVGDDARQPGGVEQALVEIEFPGAGLLGHQLALQSVGEPRNDALQMRQLLIEQMAQPRQLVGVAQLIGFDDLVRSDAEGAVYRGVVVAAARLLAGTAGTARVVVARTGHHLAVTRLGGVLRVLGRSLGGRTLVGSLGAGGGALALALVFALRFLAALLFFGVLRLVGFAEIDLEVLQQLAGRPRIGVLIEDRAVEVAEILADARFEPGAPQ